MQTKIEKANGLWWRLLTTMSVLAILFMVNTTATAQDKKTSDDKVY